MLVDGREAVPQTVLQLCHLKYVIPRLCLSNPGLVHIICLSGTDKEYPHWKNNLGYGGLNEQALNNSVYERRVDGQVAWRDNTKKEIAKCDRSLRTGHVCAVAFTEGLVLPQERKLHCVVSQRYR